MNKIQIKSWLNDSILFECEAENMKDALRQAVKSGADLYGADLSGANLSGANLSGANLSGANLSGANLSGAKIEDFTVIKTIHIMGSRNTVTWYGNGNIHIGCYMKTIDEWLNEYRAVGEVF
jgi:hypothetical protein